MAAERKAPGADYPDNMPPTHTSSSNNTGAEVQTWVLPQNLPSWTVTGSSATYTLTFSRTSS